VKFLRYFSRNWTWLPSHLQYNRNFDAQELRKRYGEGCWVLITGFANGIGFSYAKEFARLGFNLVLVDFQKERSEKSERWIRQFNNGIKTRVIILDLTKDSETIRTAIS
jgi:short-subunit dehydrogenase